MGPEQIGLVKESWKIILPISEQAAELFHKKLFILNPELKLLFKGDMKEQGRKLMVVLNTAVTGLEMLDVIIPVIQESGRRHVHFGVKDKDYDTVGEALLWALDESLGDDFTEDVKAAWLEIYTLLANTMKEAASRVA